MLAAAGVAIALVLVAVAVLALAPDGRDRDGSRPATPRGSAGGGEAVSIRPAGFLVDAAELERVASRAAAGEEPWASAVSDLEREADEAQRRRPSPVEVLRIEGTEGDFVDDSADAYTLALAFALTGEQAYADASARFVTAWSATARATEDTCTDDGSCNTSLVIGRVAPAFVFAADLIEPAGVLDDGEIAGFRSWIGDVLLPAASERTNNWGDAGTFFRIAGTSYLGDGPGLAAAIATWKDQADLIEADGEIPEETRRGRKGLQYSQEALLYKVASARIAERQGVDLWSYRGARGGSLEVALDLVAASLADPEGWEWHDDVEVPTPAPLWELAAARWPKPAYRSLAASKRPFGPGGHSAIRWTTLAGGAGSD